MVEIDTGRLLLRPFTPEDADDYHRQVFSDPEVMQYLPGGKPQPKEKTQGWVNYIIEHWERHNFGPWALVYKEDQALIGECGLNVIPNTTDVEVLYDLGKAYWGRGLATEASLASLWYGFEKLGLGEIIAIAFPENAASLRVLDKIGMQPQGLTDKYYNLTLMCYTLRREDFQGSGDKYTVRMLGNE